MHLSVYEQSEIFRCAFLFGVILGLYYDVFRLLRALGADSSACVFVQDIFFSCTASIACFMFAQTTVHGHFRLFVMIGHLLGFIAYRIAPGLVTGRLYGLLGKLFKFALDLMNKVISAAGRLFCKISANLSRSIRKIHHLKPISPKKNDDGNNKRVKKRFKVRFSPHYRLLSKKI